MRFELLGPVRLLDASGSPVALPPMSRRVLAMLLCHRNRAVSVDLLVDALWCGQRVADADKKLHVHVYRLRRVLDRPERLRFGPGGYRLSVYSDELDADQFEILASEGMELAESEPDRARRVLTKALELWTGDVVGEVAGQAVLAGEAERLAERRHAVVEARYAAELATGRYAEVVAGLTEVVAGHPLREQPYALLMRALAGCGRQAEALAVYRRARRTLVDELGVEPGERLRAAELAVLAGDEVERSARAPSPAQLPAAVGGFVGRADELAELDRLLDGAAGADQPVVISAVSGTAGVGKTALVLTWAHRVRERFVDGQLYVDLRGYGPERPVSASEALAGFLSALGVPRSAAPDGEADRAARFRSLVAGRRMLLVLDNAYSVEQVRPLLPGTSTCCVLVTSRDALTGLVVREGAHRLDLDLLSSAEATELLHTLAGDRLAAHADATAALVEHCARLPLALRITAELVRAQSAVPVGELVAGLTGEQDRLDLLDAGGDPYTAVRAVFSWSYHYLPPDGARLFRLFGLHPGPDTEPYALAALSGQDLRGTRRQLDVLARASLVDRQAGGRYRMHDLLRAYAAELAAGAEPDADRRAATARLGDYLLHTASAAMRLVSPTDAHRYPEPDRPGTAPSGPVPDLSGSGAAMAWLDAECATLTAFAVAVGHDLPDLVVRLSTVLFRYYHLSGNFDDGSTMHQAAIDAAAACGDLAGEGNARDDLAGLLWRQARFQRALTQLRGAAEASARAGDPDLYAGVLGHLGIVYSQLGQQEEALRHLEVAQRTVSADNDRERAHLLNILGCLYRILGRLDEALHCLGQALDAAVRTGSKWHEGSALDSIGLVHERRGEARDALDLYHRARDIAHEIGDRPAEGITLAHVGSAHARLGELDQARSHLLDALGITRATGHRRAEPEVLNLLGEVCLLQGDPAGAAAHHADALTIGSAIEYRAVQAAAEEGLGAAKAALGEPAAAGAHWRRALELYTDMGMPDARRVRDRLRSVSD